MALEYWDFDGSPVTFVPETGVVMNFAFSPPWRVARAPNPASDTPIDKRTFDGHFAGVRPH